MKLTIKKPYTILYCKDVHNGYILYNSYIFPVHITGDILKLLDDPEYEVEGGDFYSWYRFTISKGKRILSDKQKQNYYDIIDIMKSMTDSYTTIYDHSILKHLFTNKDDILLILRGNVKYITQEKYDKLKYIFSKQK